MANSLRLAFLHNNLLGNILVTLGFGEWADFTLAWPSFDGIAQYGMYDWLDCFSGYVLMPLGCLLICLFVMKAWGWDGYERTLTYNGRDGKLSKLDRIKIKHMVPAFMLIILLNVFGIIKQTQTAKKGRSAVLSLYGNRDHR